jgi:hypothetical protein
MLTVSGFTLRVQLEAGGIGDAELGGDVLSDLEGDVRWIREERAQEPHGPQLHPEAETGVVTPSLVHELSVGVVQEEGPLQLRSGRRSRESPVGGYLLI